MGYARLRDFNSIVANSLKDALVEMKAEGADEFVLDLRGNGGGAFQSALGVAGLFMDTKPITYVVSIEYFQYKYITSWYMCTYALVDLI